MLKKIDSGSKWHSVQNSFPSVTATTLLDLSNSWFLPLEKGMSITKVVVRFIGLMHTDCLKLCLTTCLYSIILTIILIFRLGETMIRKMLFLISNELQVNWRTLGVYRLCEISQKDKYMILLMCGMKKRCKRSYLQNRNRLRIRKQIYSY